MPLITLNANFNVENAQKSTKKKVKNTQKKTILSFIGLKTVQTNPLAYLPVLRFYFLLGCFKLLALITIVLSGVGGCFGRASGRLGG